MKLEVLILEIRSLQSHILEGVIVSRFLEGRSIK